MTTPGNKPDAGAKRVFPRVQVRGLPRERGRQYGAAARERVLVSLESYERVFKYYAGWDWGKVRREAAGYAGPIEALDSRYLEEMQGIAEGAGVDLEDILALNVRTEVMFAARARQAMGRSSSPGECTSFCILPSASLSGHVLVGENWDWLLHCYDTLVVLEVEQEAGPDYVTVVEAGLLAKMGMNSAGIGLATNALVTGQDCGVPGIPYHVMLRSLLDAETVTDALNRVTHAVRSSSGNYLVAHRDGVAVDIEAAPGDHGRLAFLLPNHGVLVHTNHFLSPHLDVDNVSVWAMPDSVVRLGRARTTLAEADGRISLESLKTALADHADFPAGVCAHPDEREPLLERGATVTSVIMDLDDRCLWLADGTPCSTAYRALDYSELLAKPSSTGGASAAAPTPPKVR